MYVWIFGAWRTIGFVAVSTALIYLSVVVGLRIGEQRTLAEMRSYDFAVAVALGSIIGRTATAARPSYVQGLAAVVVLLMLHRLVSIVRIRSRLARRLLDRRPVELVRNGEVLADGLIDAHLSESDLSMLLRVRGIHGPRQVQVAFLEASGAISVVPKAGPVDTRADDPGSARQR